MGWTSKIYPDRFVPFSLYSIAEERCVFLVESRGIHTSTRTNIKNRMKKIIPTMFAMVLAISSVSLLVGCEQNVTVDPDAAANQKQEATIEDENLTAEEKKKLDADITPPPEMPAPKTPSAPEKK